MVTLKEDSLPPASSPSLDPSINTKKKKKKKKKKKSAESGGTSSAAAPTTKVKKKNQQPLSKFANYRIIEKDTRFSQSTLWNTQANFYKSYGINAWEWVPNFISSNCFIAKSYAEMIMSFFRDTFGHKAATMMAGEEDDVKFDPSQPLYVFEFGTGTGKFSYLLLKKLLQLHHTLPYFPGTRIRPKICYVMTDFVQNNIDFWKKTGFFSTFLELGLVDFALFDVQNDTSVTLLNSGITIDVGTVKNPMIIIGNYLLDSLPTDYFRVIDDTVEEVRINVVTDREITDPRLCEHVKIKWTYDTQSDEQLATPYYESEDHEAVLRWYIDTLKAPRGSPQPHVDSMTEERGDRDDDENDNELALIDKIFSMCEAKAKQNGATNASSSTKPEGDAQGTPEAVKEKKEGEGEVKGEGSKGKSVATLIPLPVASINFLNNMEKLANGRPLLCLFADKAYVNLKELRCRTPDVEIHGTFSLVANIHALGVHVERKGGLALHHEDPNCDFKVSALVLGGTQKETSFDIEGDYSKFPTSIGDISPTLENNVPVIAKEAAPLKEEGKKKAKKEDVIVYDDSPLIFPETRISSQSHCVLVAKQEPKTCVGGSGYNNLRAAYHSNVVVFGPDHFFTLWKSIKSDSFPSQALNVIRISDHDPDVFYKFRKGLEEKVANSAFCDQIFEALHACWSNYYPNCPSQMDDIPFSIASCFLNSDQFEVAITYFQLSLRYHGKHESTYFNIGMALECLGREAEAKDYYLKSMTVNPRFIRAVKKHDKLVKKLNGTDVDEVKVPPILMDVQEDADDSTTGEEDDKKPKTVPQYDKRTKKNAKSSGSEDDEDDEEDDEDEDDEEEKDSEEEESETEDEEEEQD